jgi:hypothetical protein
LIIPIDLKPLKATMPITTPTILDQISAEKTKVSERLARLDIDRATVATQLTDLETAERVLTRVSKMPARRRTSAANPTHRAWVSAFWPWRPAGPSKNFIWRAPTIAQTTLAS